MDFLSQMDPQVRTWLVIPALIFLARILDVSIGTLRIVFIAQGAKSIAPLLGFVEVLIWLAAMGQIMQNLNNVASYLAWASGFAVGNYVGLYIEEKIAMGKLIVRVITAKPGTLLVESLRDGGFGVTTVEAQGGLGPVHIIYTVVQRRDVDTVVGIVKEHNPNAFYTVENVRYTSKSPYYNLREAVKLRK